MPRFSPLQRKTRRRRLYLKRKAELVETKTSSDNESDVDQPLLLETSSLSGDQCQPANVDWDVSSISDSSSTEHVDLIDSDSFTEDDSESEDDISSSLPEKLYNSCRISEEDSLSFVSVMSSKFKLSKRATSAILEFANLHLPKGTSYPKSYHRFQKKLCFDKTWSRKVYFCNPCNQHLSKDGTCCVCKTQFSPAFLKNSGRFFLICDIKKQIESILLNKKVCDAISKKFGKVPGQTISDITDGMMYKSLSKETFDLTCSFNTDGAKCSNSNPPKSVWPFLLTLNELPYRLRKQNVLLGGLWHDRSKPKMKMFLEPIVEYLNEVNRSHVTWELSNGCKITSRIHFVLCPVDSPARCQMQGLKQYNGHYGCAWCLHPGKVVVRGNGHARVYPVQTFTPDLRTDEQFRTSVFNKNWEKGITCESPLVNLPQFDMCWGFSVDYLHCVLLGVVQQFAALWFESGKQPYKICKKLTEVEELFKSVKVPKETTRTPRDLGPAPIKMKGSEWRTWLFLAPLLLKDILDFVYLEHFGLLACSVHVLLTEGITINDIITAEKNLIKFASDVLVLYGEEHCTHNVHLLTHLPRCVLNWGPLFESSAFAYESCNGKLVGHIHSSKGVLNQIATHHFAEIQAAGLELSIDDPEVTKFFEETLKMQYDPRSKFGLVKPKSVCVKSVPVIEQILRFCVRPKAVQESKKAYVNYHLYSSEHCDTKKRSNSVIKIGEKLGVIRGFYEAQCSCEIDCACVRVFVLARTFKARVIGKLPYAFRTKRNCKITLEIIPIDKVELVKFFIFEIKEKVFYVSLPNLIEGD